MTEDAIDRIVQEWNRERPELDVSPTHVLQRITRLYLLQSASFAEVFGRYGLTFGEYEVLAALVRSGPPHRMKPSELVDAVVLSSGAMTNRIDRVETAGLVERLPDPDDRRGTLVALTEKGRQAVDEAVRAHVANEEQLLSALSADERRQLADLLRTLLVSEPFVTLGPNRPPRTNGRVVDQVARARRPRRR
ncbi:MAG: MarR family transcriptional regulator [Chloroflexi bacterium]|jgi:DNA-binding MarR family transcriptional regulator|nr:MarR family transcriptional regulator [Chloroflexota bacterium]